MLIARYFIGHLYLRLYNEDNVVQWYRETFFKHFFALAR
jgi:hypothetical protein